MPARASISTMEAKRALEEFIIYCGGGIPWRRDGFSVYPWVVSEPESRRWTSVASGSSRNSNYYGANVLGNSAIRGTSVFQGYSTFQNDEAGDIGSMHPHSSMWPMR